jgi:glutamine synthetase type III
LDWKNNPELGDTNHQRVGAAIRKERAYFLVQSKIQNENPKIAKISP